MQATDHTTDPDTEATRTLYDLVASPVTNPFTIDVMVPSAADAGAKSRQVAGLSLVAQVLSINSFVRADQAMALALNSRPRKTLAGEHVQRHLTSTYG